MPAWDDLNARVRGLSSSLLGRARLLELGASADLQQLARELRGSPYAAVLPSESPSVPELDRAIRRVAARRVATIARRAGPKRRRLLAVLFEDEDRRSVVALLRGAAAGVPPEERIAGLVPTPGLPERALRELSRLPTTSAVAAMLTSWGDPYGSAVLPEAASARADLLRLELAVNTTFARRARQAARHSRAVREYVQETIDVENACAALVLAGPGTDLLPEGAFLSGGRVLDRGTFERAAAQPNPFGALSVLASAIREGPLGAALRHAGLPSRLERAALHARVLAWRRRSRIAPLGPAIVFLFLLRMRAEAFDLRTLAWSLAFGVAARTADLVSA